MANTRKGDGAILVEDDDEGAQQGTCEARGACPGCAGVGAPSRGACGRCGQGERGGLSEAGRAVTL